MDAQVDALYFQARENGVSYGIIEERALDPSFDSRFGARVRLSAPTSHDCWEVSAQFLHYHARIKSRQRGSGFPNWSHLTRFDEVFNLWRLHLGMGDLFLSHSWEVSRCFSLTPFWGLTYAMIRHKLFVDYQTVELSMKDKFWGVGPLFGFLGRWDFGWNVSLFSWWAYRLLYGEVYLHQDEAKIIKLFDKYPKIQQIIEARIGLQWCYKWFYARIGFEVVLFPSINQLLRCADLSMVGKVYGNQGDLSLHGLSLGLGIKF